MYYLLVILQVIGWVKLTDTDEEVSWLPFYYLFKKSKRTENVEQPPLSTGDGDEKKTKAKSNRRGRKTKEMYNNN
jgi:hypothetical protein